MLYGDDIQDYRMTLIRAWEKYRQAEVLEPLEHLIVQIILQHPEYMSVFENPEDFLTKQWDEDKNPFFHIAQHIMVAEMLSVDRPAGIIALYKKLSLHVGNTHEVEHELAKAFSKEMRAAMREGREMDFAKVMAGIASLLPGE